VRVVPACDRCGADIVNVEIRSDNLQGLLPNCSRHPVPWPCSKSRAHESRRFAQQGHLPRPKEALTREAVFSRGGGLHRHAAPGLTPDVFSRGREVGEGLQSFQPQEFRREKSKQRPSSGDRSFNPCLTAYLRTHIRGLSADRARTKPRQRRESAKACPRMTVRSTAWPRAKSAAWVFCLFTPVSEG
jgi:hypothetical protein